MRKCSMLSLGVLSIFLDQGPKLFFNLNNDDLLLLLLCSHCNDDLGHSRLEAWPQRLERLRKLIA